MTVFMRLFVTGGLRAASISPKILAGNETYPRRHLAGHHLPIRDWNYVFAVTSQDLGPCQLKIRRHGTKCSAIQPVFVLFSTRNVRANVSKQCDGGGVSGTHAGSMSRKRVPFAAANVRVVKK
jgi:hypothetical protein